MIGVEVRVATAPELRVVVELLANRLVDKVVAEVNMVLGSDGTELEDGAHPGLVQIQVPLPLGV